jgi:hypothetical protein
MRAAPSELARLQLLFRFFYDVDGMWELFSVLDAHLNRAAAPAPDIGTARIVHTRLLCGVMRVCGCAWHACVWCPTYFLCLRITGAAAAAVHAVDPRKRPRSWRRAVSAGSQQRLALQRRRTYYKRCVIPITPPHAHTHMRTRTHSISEL